MIELAALVLAFAAGGLTTTWALNLAQLLHRVTESEPER